jgi:hypothetical protein
MFAEQALADTEAAVFRLFEILPEVDVIDLNVLDPESEILIAAGTVHRSDIAATRPYLLSVGIRLREIGIEYHFATPGERDSSANAPIADFAR